MHAWGFYATDDEKWQQYERHPGKLTRDALVLDEAEQVRILVGHCRLSTSGTPEDNRNNQPFLSTGMAFAHNGNIYDSGDVAKRWELELQTETDSEILLRLAEFMYSKGGSRRIAIQSAVNCLIESPGAVLATDGESVFAYRNKLPIWEWETDEGYYFCSVKPDESAVQIEERRIHSRGKPMVATKEMLAQMESARRRNEQSKGQ
jgi:glutamine phosphoribosylpyrophosphate amidotransferase